MTTCRENNQIKDTYKSYEEMVDDLARKKIDYDIPNGIPAHASVLISAMFKNAKNSMDIFCRELSNDVYNNNQLIDYAINFVIKEKGKIRVILERDLKQNLFERPIIYKIASEIYKEKDKKREVGSITVRVRGEDTSNHFCIMDKSAYRLEKDKAQRTASANFGNIGIAKELTESFEKMFLESKEVFAI